MTVSTNYLFGACIRDIDSDNACINLKPKGHGSRYVERPAVMADRRRDGGRNFLGTSQPGGPSETESQGSKALHEASLRYSFAKIRATPTPCDPVHCLRDSGFVSVLANKYSVVPHVVKRDGQLQAANFVSECEYVHLKQSSAIKVPLRGGQGTLETPLRGGLGVSLRQSTIRQMTSNIVHHVRLIAYMINKFYRDVRYSPSISSSITH
jgi:hypothetical protein